MSPSEEENENPRNFDLWETRKSYSQPTVKFTISSITDAISFQETRFENSGNRHKTNGISWRHPLELKMKTRAKSRLVQLTWQSRKKVIISNKPQKTAEPNPALIAALNSAHEIKKKYMASDTPSLSKIGSDIQMDARQVWRTLRLAYLAPDIQLAILSGMQPKGLLLKDLVYQSIPTSWQEQRSLFGFA